MFDGREATLDVWDTGTRVGREVRLDSFGDRESTAWPGAGGVDTR
jgi:hypothetical protein